MSQENYQRIVQKIADSSGSTVGEIEDRIDRKRSKLSGFISKEGAAQIVAAELGISFDNERLKINELLPGMRKVNVVGKVFRMSPIRTFKTKNGEESKVTNLWIADDTSNIRIVLWDTNLIKLIEDGKIGEGVSVEISNGSMRDSELHLGSFSEIKVSNETFDDIKTEKVFREKEIKGLVKGENAEIRAFIVQAFEPRFFNVCSECGKKVTTEGEDFSCCTNDNAVSKKRAILTLVLDDGSESIRAVLFHESIKGLGLDPDSEEISLSTPSLLGKEMVFSGNVRQNNYFNNLEIIVENSIDVNLDNLISEMEKN